MYRYIYICIDGYTAPSSLLDIESVSLLYECISPYWKYVYRCLYIPIYIYIYIYIYIRSVCLYISIYTYSIAYLCKCRCPKIRPHTYKPRGGPFPRRMSLGGDTKSNCLFLSLSLTSPQSGHGLSLRLPVGGLRPPERSSKGIRGSRQVYRHPAYHQSSSTSSSSSCCCCCCC